MKQLNIWGVVAYLLAKHYPVGHQFVANNREGWVTVIHLGIKEDKLTYKTVQHYESLGDVLAALGMDEKTAWKEYRAQHPQNLYFREQSYIEGIQSSYPPQVQPSKGVVESG